MRATFFAVLAIVASAVCLEAFGQINTGQNTGMTGGFGTSGGIGTTTTGMTGTTGMTTGTTSRTSTSSGMFGSRTYGQGITSGAGGFTGGTAAGGRGLTGMSGTGGMGGTTGATGMSTTGTQFMQQARQAGFVGADSRDITAGLLGGIMAGQGTQGQSINQRLRSGTGTLGALGTMGNMGRTGALGTLGSTMRTGTLQSGMLQSGALRTGMGGMAGRNVGTGAGFGLGGMGAGTYGAGRGTMANREVPATLQVAFEHPQPQRNQVNSKLAERLTRSPSIRFRSPVEINLQSDGTVVLRGTVATAHDRAVAERLARLEPGVWRVQNELQVATEQPEQPGRSN